MTAHARCVMGKCHRPLSDGLRQSEHVSATMTFGDFSFDTRCNAVLWQISVLEGDVCVSSEVSCSSSIHVIM